MEEAIRAVLAIRSQALSTAERFVLVSLAGHAQPNSEGVLTAWPSVGTIAAETGLTRTYVQNCLKVLRGHGAIFQTGERRDRVNVWGLHLQVIRAWSHEGGEI